MEKTYIIGFDVVEPLIVFETFASFGLKVVDYMEHTNIYHIVFEGSKENLKRWYEKYYGTGESFEDYFSDFPSKTFIMSEKFDGDLYDQDKILEEI